MSRILLLEDDPVLGRGLKLSLELEGYEVVWATDLRTASKTLADSFDLYLLDWGLPDGTGIQFCEKVREKSGKVPVIFLTARTDEESAVTALSTGASDFVRKPFGQAELFARIKRALQETLVREEQLRYADLVILPKQRKVLYRQQEIALNRKEFEILSYLVKKGGTAVSREELVGIIDPDGEVSDRTVDSHLSHLRSKFKAAGVEGLQIASVYGFGYQLEKT